MNLELIEKIKNYPIIDRNLLMKHFDYNKEYSSLVLQRLLKRGIIKKIIKGKYSAIDNIYKIASNIYFPSYISLLTASMLKGSTEQIINTVQVASNYNRTIDLINYKIHFIKFNKNCLFGYKNDNGLFIADNEKLIIDMLMYRNHSGNFSEILKSITNLEFNVKKLESYLRKINNNSLIKRIGFLFEKYKKIDVSNRFKLDNNYINLDSLKISKKTNSRWRVKHD